MTSRPAIARAIGTDQTTAAPPARTRIRRISSEAYADELIASELKTASAFGLESRSPISSSLARGRPMATAFTLAQARPTGVFGALAARLAVSWPGPV